MTAPSLLAVPFPEDPRCPTCGFVFARTIDTPPCPTCGRVPRPIPEEPEPITYVPCPDCGHLVRPLGPDEPLPDHVCAATMAASVERWLEEYGNHDAAAPAWYNGRLLLFVLRQWVAEPGDAHHARACLADDARWQQAQFYTTAAIAEHSNPGLYDMLPADLLRACHLATAGEGMRRHGLSDTPDTRRLLDAARSGAPPSQWPPLRRMALVTTLVYGQRTGQPAGDWRTGQPNSPWLYDGNPQQDIRVDADQDTEALDHQARRTKGVHRAQLDAWFGADRAPTLRGAFGAPLGRKARDADYMAAVEELVPAALTEADKFADKPKALGRRVRKMLDTTYQRVYSRRKRADHQPPGYPGGKAAFRTDGWARLRQDVPTLPATPPTSA